VNLAARWGNRNRCFPSDPDGTVAQQTTRYITSELLPMADAEVDLQSGSTSLMDVLSVKARRPVQPARAELSPGLL
jgi:predicted deacylase